VTTLAAAAIVLNWRRSAETLACLDSLSGAVTVPSQIIVVDNASGDGSAEAIRRGNPDVAVLETSSNLGYAGGNNFGVRWAFEHGFEAVLVLNNDIRVEPEFLSPLLQALYASPKTGAATPLVIADDHPDEIWALGLTVDHKSAGVRRRLSGNRISSLTELTPVEVNAASGSAMLVTRDVVDDVGLLDEKYFLYYEEVDWCMRMRRAGYRIMAVPSSVVRHRVSSTLGADSPIIDYYMLRNQMRLVQRHWTGLRRTTLLSAVVARNLATIAAYTIKPHGGRRIAHRNARLLAIRDAALGRWGPMGDDVAAACGVPRT
jgi:hypothetical protein